MRGFNQNTLDVLHLTMNQFLQQNTQLPAKVSFTFFNLVLLKQFFPLSHCFLLSQGAWSLSPHLQAAEALTPSCDRNLAHLCSLFFGTFIQAHALFSWPDSRIPCPSSSLNFSIVQIVTPFLFCLISESCVSGLMSYFQMLILQLDFTYWDYWENYFTSSTPSSAFSPFLLIGFL